MESVCDRVGVLAKGNLVASGTPSEITQTRDRVAVQIAQAERDAVLASEVQSWGGRVEAAATASERGGPGRRWCTE